MVKNVKNTMPTTAVVAANAAEETRQIEQQQVAPTEGQAQVPAATSEQPATTGSEDVAMIDRAQEQKLEQSETHLEPDSSETGTNAKKAQTPTLHT
ncbi:hypothetical protein BJV82DRAFT_675957 [Fennellomyces sp. T-0311]|nr:hypothetical protein BJV82DRAFT_675957 [Fennellomyces sp. T-0311]